MRNLVQGRGAGILFGLAIFAVFATALVTRGPKWLGDFDQSFYITIAYDIVRHGAFSNGVFDHVDSTRSVPPPGRFFAPLYPAIVAALMKIDSRFDRAARCSVESHAGGRNGSECEVYALPVRLAHAAFLAIGVLAIAVATRLLVGAGPTFYLAGAVATAALLPEADLFSFVMTESLTFCLHSLSVVGLLWSLKAPHILRFVFTGGMLGFLVLTRTAYLTLLFVLPVLMVVFCRSLPRKTLSACLAGFLAGFATVVAPWSARNMISTGHWGLTEEYGSATVIERFAFNDMTPQEFFLAFPYCLPVVGPPIINAAFGKKAMERFDYRTSDSFFNTGRGLRDKLLKTHGRLDPLIATLVKEEMKTKWWRHLLISMPLGWCGMWVGGALGIVLVPLFLAVIVSIAGALRRDILIYSAPALAMLAMHALIANHYTRYNLILIGPLALAASIALSLFLSARLQTFNRS